MHQRITELMFFVIRANVGTHICERVWQLKALIASFLNKKFLDEFWDNMKTHVNLFSNKVQREYPSRWKLEGKEMKS